MGWKGSLCEMPLWALSRFFDAGIDPQREAPREILVLRPNDYGDLLTSTPVFEALRRRFPTSRIVAGVGRWGRAVLENNPNVDEIVELDVPWNNKFVADQSLRNGFDFIWHSAQVQALRKRGGFDAGIDVLGSHMGAMLMMRLGVRYRVGVRGYRGGWSACSKHIVFSTRVHVARAALAQAELLGATSLPEARPQLFLSAAERSAGAQRWAEGTADGRRPVRLLVGCAAGLADKSWPARAMGETLRQIVLACEAGDIDVDVVMVGGAPDVARAAEVLAHCGDTGRIRSLVGSTTLRVTFALAEQADVVITNPSMLLHVAAAFRRPTVAIVGGTFADAQLHDTVWGYPAPYCSVGPSVVVKGAHAVNWPSVGEVAEVVLKVIGVPVTT
ncbi:glycosyltransferase family 9 protein [Paraburkholderia lacunae]|uniref:Heptosyltransferase n=1 Tax=Paraburkholderia lacunae TaxID=2211104 RepID=A0A370NDI7_9BURK|nr:glycosyltransferase family 9 protein [Paraburkholderia lacunae]RDK03666.1 heptosyltransferase [Paraburkholderia lacunae]